MPEGNELHRFAELQSALFSGRKVTVTAPNGRFTQGAAHLDGRKLKTIDAFGKHLFYDFGRGRQLHVHLGLFGKFRAGDMPFPDPKGALRMRISTPENWLELRGPTACEVLAEAEREALLHRIGPDPLRADADAKVAIERIRKSRTPIGALLMDQSVIGGLGNIFRAELLFRAQLNPFQPGNTVSASALHKLWAEAVQLMRAAMVDRRIVTTKNKDRPHPNGKARRGETHYVYHRTGLPCFVCGVHVSAREFVARRVYWCPGCQPALTKP